MSSFSKQDLVLKKIIKAIEEDRKQVILHLGNYYKSYLMLIIYTSAEDVFIWTTD